MMGELLWKADLGDGRYRNPILCTDYSDPDVIRVGDVFYMTASSFQYTPGLPILKSRDLIHWDLVSYALDNIREAGYERPRHGDGVWAPAIRYYDGIFYIFYGMPDEGIYCVKTADPAGKWDAPVLVRPAKGFIDPCPFIDEDGRMYVVHAYAKSRIGFKSKLGIFEISRETLQAVSEDAFIFDGEDPAHPAITIEGPKVYRRDGYVYILAPAGGVTYGDQRALRAKDVHGPYEIRTVCSQGSTPVNGPHQGGLVDTPSGEEWFLHFQDAGMYGRITHLQPVCWKDGWPVIGVDPDGDGCGEPVLTYRKPAAGAGETPHEPPAADDFPGGKYGLQWQWTADHDDARFLCGRQEGQEDVPADGLRLRAVDVTGEDEPVLWDCPNIFTQKFCCRAFTAQAEIDLRELAAGGRAGMCAFGGQYAALSLHLTEDGRSILEYAESAGEGKTRQEEVLSAKEIARPERLFFRMRLAGAGDGAAPAAVTFAWSADGETWQETGHAFTPSKHTWVGARIGLFALAKAGGEAGCVTVRNFRIEALPENA